MPYRVLRVKITWRFCRSSGRITRPAVPSDIDARPTVSSPPLHAKLAPRGALSILSSFFQFLEARGRRVAASASADGRDRAPNEEADAVQVPRRPRRRRGRGAAQRVGSRSRRGRPLHAPLPHGRRLARPRDHARRGRARPVRLPAQAGEADGELPRRLSYTPSSDDDDSSNKSSGCGAGLLISSSSLSRPFRGDGANP